ncbi:TetR/AcrR family transcriptional regulator [Rothia uropygialis]|uniref:TetR/AcrR family transcriptional regulator n=1 Tax=Kocuria sp. 36 TaxID=1415402 RepID=UPI00101D7FA9|nr:TetR/AcrR family transcriptional regulator [Kocuria sp. 36]
MQTTEPSLRERRRARTWDSIHEAARELASERGIKQTTAELIAEKAGVSPRTFFNYFATKEDAIIGLRPPQMTQEILGSVQESESGGLLAQASQLLARVMYDSFAGDLKEVMGQLVEDREYMRQRMKIHMLRCEQELKDFLLRMDWSVYQETGQFVPREDEDSDPVPEQEERIRAIILMATAVLRYVDYGARSSREEFAASINRTVNLFSTIVKEPR